MKRITLLFGAILLCVGTFAQLGYYYSTLAFDSKA